MYGALLSVKTNIFSLLNNIDRVPTSSYNHSNKSTAGKHPICTIALHSSKCHFQFGMCLNMGISIKCVTFENDQIFISKHWIIELGYQYWLALIRRSGVGGGSYFPVLFMFMHPMSSQISLLNNKANVNNVNSILTCVNKIENISYYVIYI